MNKKNDDQKNKLENYHYQANKTLVKNLIVLNSADVAAAITY